MSETKTGVQLESHMVIRRPLVTEKGVHASERLNAYAFEIHPLATKSDVKVAVEELWVCVLLLFGLRAEKASLAGRVLQWGILRVGRRLL